MKALFLNTPAGLSLREVEKPSPKQGEVLVKMRASGICGTDIEKAKGHWVTSKILGHEVVGEVVDIGTEVSGLSPGDRVFTHHQTACMSCELCRRGEFTFCPGFRKSNIVPCGFSEYYIVPQWNVTRGAVVKLPAGLSYEEGTLIEPLACCLRAISKVEPLSISRAFVSGAGPVGLLYVKLLRSLGVSHLEVADVKEYRLSFAKKMGVEGTFNPASDTEMAKLFERPEEEKPELIIVATGSVSAFRDAIRAVAMAGKVLLFGVPAPGATAEVDLEKLLMRGVNVVTSYASTEKETVEATKMLGQRSIHVSDLITHRFPLSEAVEAFRTVELEACVKAVVLD